MEAAREHRTYDHRLKALVAYSGNPELFSSLEIPRTTMNTWIHSEMPSVVSHDVLEMDHLDLQQRVLELANENNHLKAKIALFSSAKESIGWNLDFSRFPSEESKTKILNLIAVAAIVLPLLECLQIFGLSASRYFSWLRREKGCHLDDHSSCPHTFPCKLTASEVTTIGDMVRDKAYAVQSKN